MYRVPDIRFRLPRYPAIFSNPVPAPVTAKMVPGTGYLSRIVLGSFWQLVHPANGRHIVNMLDVNKDKVVWLHVVVFKWKMSDLRKSSAICEYFSVDSMNVSVAVCKLCNSKLSRGGNPKILSTSPLIQHLRAKHACEFNVYTKASNAKAKATEKLSQLAASTTSPMASTSHSQCHQQIHTRICIRRILIYKICIRWKRILAGSVTSLVNRHIARVTSPYLSSCTVRWCLAEVLACKDQHRGTGSGSALEACLRQCAVQICIYFTYLLS